MRHTYTIYVLAAAICLLGCEGIDTQQFSGTGFGQLVTEVAKTAGVKEHDAQRYGRIAGGAVHATTGFRVEEELAIGQGVALSAFQRFGPLTKDQALMRYVNLVGSTCGAVSDRPGLAYKFAVIESDMVNAFAGPGGYIFVTTGALKLMKNEAELAGVLAHEIAHVTLRHSLKTLQRSKLFETGLEVAGDKYQKKYGGYVDLMNQTLFERGLDKSMEFEADQYGTDYAFAAGYHPSGLRDFLTALRQKQAGRTGGWFSTHPDTGSRISRLNSYLGRNAPSPRGYVQLASRFQRECRGKLR